MFGAICKTHLELVRLQSASKRTYFRSGDTMYFSAFSCLCQISHNGSVAFFKIIISLLLTNVAFVIRTFTVDVSITNIDNPPDGSLYTSSPSKRKINKLQTLSLHNVSIQKKQSPFIHVPLKGFQRNPFPMISDRRSRLPLTRAPSSST